MDVRIIESGDQLWKTGENKTSKCNIHILAGRNKRKRQASKYCVHREKVELCRYNIRRSTLEDRTNRNKQVQYL